MTFVWCKQVPPNLRKKYQSACNFSGMFKILKHKVANGHLTSSFSLKTTSERTVNTTEVVGWKSCLLGKLITSNERLNESVTSLELEQILMTNDNWSKQGFYVPFNSQGHIGTGPELCYLRELNPHRSDSL